MPKVNNAFEPAIRRSYELLIAGSSIGRGELRLLIGEPA